MPSACVPSTGTRMQRERLANNVNKKKTFWVKLGTKRARKGISGSRFTFFLQNLFNDSFLVAMENVTGTPANILGIP